MTRTSASTEDTSGSDDAGRAEAPEVRPVYPMRLQKFLARAGVASRRGSEDLMTAGRVTVNGAVVTGLGTKVDPSVDKVAVDGRTVSLQPGPVYLVLNKPAGYVTTMRDPHRRPTVADLMPAEPAGLFPVGRLDQQTEGLLLLTTDGELAQRLMHPRYHVTKTYLATVEGSPPEEALRALREGVALDDGRTAPAEVELAEPSGQPAVIRLRIREGRKRQVRRMMSAVGYPVTHLERVAFGPIGLGTLGRGEIRALTPEEVAALRAAAGLTGRDPTV